MASTEEPEDPFEGLVLDDDFVRGATRYEPPARTREAIAQNPDGAPQRAFDRRPATVHSLAGRRRRLRGRRAQLWVSLLIVLGVIGGTAYVVSTAQEPAHLTADGSPSPTPSTRTVSRTHYDRGHCYAWDQDLLDAPVDDVSCSGKHLYEHVVTLEIVAQPGAPYPVDDFDAYEAQYCDRPVTAYLGGPVDPRGNLYVTALTPQEQYWRTGDRTMHCGVARHGLDAFVEDPDRYDAVAGAADQAHQELLSPVGTCVRRTAGAYGAVACPEPHTYEVLGVATVSGVGGVPSDSYYQRAVSPVCERQVRTYLGRSLRAKERISWDVLAPGSWAAGSRHVQCYLEFLGLQQTGSHRAAPQKA